VPQGFFQFHAALFQGTIHYHVTKHFDRSVGNAFALFVVKTDGLFHHHSLGGVTAYHIRYGFGQFTIYNQRYFQPACFSHLKPL
jgi:hypothetical protein